MLREGPGMTFFPFREIIFDPDNGIRFFLQGYSRIRECQDVGSIILPDPVHILHQDRIRFYGLHLSHGKVKSEGQSG